jgi:hypothetical protein
MGKIERTQGIRRRRNFIVTVSMEGTWLVREGTTLSIK